eukprot:9502172-Pyramimonas_sp.AAC.1
MLAHRLAQSFWLGRSGAGEGENDACRPRSARGHAGLTKLNAWRAPAGCPGKAEHFRHAGLAKLKSW